MKFSRVMVVAPIKFRITPKLGRTSPMKRRIPIETLLNTILLILKSEDNILGFKFIVYQANTYLEELSLAFQRIDMEDLR